MIHREMDKTNSYLFHSGTCTAAYEFMGSHPATVDGTAGYVFRVWAPNAKAVSVVGDFDQWDDTKAPMEKGEGGIWSCFIPGMDRYDNYKYAVTGPDGEQRMKADPYGFHFETRPGNCSKIYDLGEYSWGDDKWRKFRREHPFSASPLNIYEVHLGSWRRRENGDFIDYRDLAVQLAAYVKEMGFDYIELMPVTEYPLDDSWGYQVTGYYAPTSRYGTPDDFKFFVDHMHQNHIGIILDWVPSHFCKDAHGLYHFDGTPCYEYADTRKGEHKSWGTSVFDYARPEVKSFLLSSAAFWLKEYHIDGLRVDAVASMLYLDYDRKDGEWVANKNGGKEHLEAIDFLKELNKTAFTIDQDVLMVAEESTAWPMVTYPPDAGGLGFNLKWNMGWMNDMCHYLKMDPFFRQHNHRDITFSMMYAFSENYVLPMSHDEVVHMKGSVLGKMPGDRWRKFAGVRGFYSYLLGHPGKKLSFMGVELGTEAEWAFQKALDWDLLENEENRQLHDFIREANAFYHKQSPLWEVDFDWQGFEWLVADDNSNNVIAFLRRDKQGKVLICVVNFSPLAYEGYRLGVPPCRELREVLNSDAERFGGSGVLNSQPVPVEWIDSHGRENSAAIRVPPLGAAFFECSGRPRAKPKAAKKPKETAADSGKSPEVKKPVRRAKAGSEAKKTPAAKTAAKKTGRSSAKTVK